ncbi:MAG: hypothetical protein WC178_03405 [Candidatus Paceibacterota bacterium]
MSEEYSLNLAFSKADLDEKEKEAIENKVKDLEAPYFSEYTPDLKAILEIAKKYQNKKNIIVEGNGGSISTMRAFWSCFGSDTGKNVFILDTDDPDYIAEIKSRCPIEDTLLIIVSKSGNSVQTISDYLLLSEYETLFVTSESGTLREIGKTNNIDMAKHPEISGRFSGITESALIPAAVAGIDIKNISKGAKEMYEKCASQKSFSENPALQFAAHLDKLEKMGYTDIFLSLYSKKLSGFFELIIQLFHESVCKEGKGQTFYGGEAPENQHHTLQRFNSGRKNSVGVFITVENFQNDSYFTAAENIRNIECRGVAIEKLEKKSMQDIIHIEFKGTWKDTTEQGIPAIHIKLKEVSPATAGALTAFFQYTAYYSAILRDVNPFDQPGVEKSKEYIFKLIKEK